MKLQMWSVLPILVLGLLSTNVFSDAIIDNQSEMTASVGDWVKHPGPQAYNGSSLLARNGAAFTWFFDPQPAGIYEVYLMWSASGPCAKAVSVDVNSLDGTQRLIVDQSVKRGKWNLLGTWYFNSSGSVTITASADPKFSTCADAVWFKLKEADTGPSAFIDSISPAQAPQGETVKFAAHGTDKFRTIIAHRWSSNINGIISNKDSFSSADLAPGTHTISYSVKNDANDWSEPVTAELTVEAPADSNALAEIDTYSEPTPVQAAPAPTSENIYVGKIYSWNGAFITSVQSKLSSMGARNMGSYWTYKNNTLNKTFYIRFVTTEAALVAALKENGSHIVTGGHSNYGLGATFATSGEFGSQKINTMYYVDDDHLLQIGSDMVSVNVDGLMYGQAYPNWKPIYKSGASALMPYTTSQGTPPYNYYITYRVPGNSTWYRVEQANGSYIERFPDTTASAWYSSSNAKPDPSRNRQYFMINSDTYYSRCATVGGWNWSKNAGKYGEDDGYMGYQYYYRSAGTGSNRVNWTLGVHASGQYRVSASWFDDPAHASNAKYTINHAGGSTTVSVSQRRTGADFWNDLGTFYFNRGDNIFTLSDNANGRVIADAIWLRPVGSTNRPIYCDNGFRYKFHYFTNTSRPNGKIVVKLNDRLDPDELGFSRMFWGTCNVNNYFLETFHRGIVFFTNANLDYYSGTRYLECYLRGYTDDRILTEVNRIQPVHEYYNFNLKPPSMR